MKISNAELIWRFEQACFRITNYPNNKTANKEFSKLETELAERLSVNIEEVRKKEL